MEYAGEIGIQEVLAAIADDEGIQRSFSLGFVRSSGDKKGSIKVVDKCRYGLPRSELKRRNKGQRNISSTPRRLHIDAGTIPVTDVSTGRYVTPLISHIIMYNNLQVKH